MPQIVDRKTVRSWTEELDAVGEQIAPRFARAELRARVRSHLRGLLSGVEKNGWQLAEEMLRPTDCSISSAGPTGTPMRSETIFGSTYSITLAMRRLCSSLRRRAS